MKKYCLYLIVLFVALGTITGQVNRSTAPKPGPAPKIQIGNYSKFVLPNGLTLFVVEDHRIPRVTYSLSFIFDPKLEAANAGIGDLTSQLIGTGTKTRTKDQINESIDFIGGSFSASPSGIYAASLKKHTEKLLEVLSDIAINATFSSEELEKKRTQFLSGLEASKDDPNSISSNVSQTLTFGKDHPYGEFATETSVKSISLDMCKAYYQTYFIPNIAYLTVVGDISPAEAKKLVEKYLSKWPKGEVKNPVYSKPQPPAGDKVVMVDRPQSVQSVISISYPVELNQGNPDYIKASVTNTLLGGGVFRLFMNLREKHAYTYGAYSRFSINPLISSFSANASVRNAVTDSAVYQILYEMKRLREEPVSADELSLVKNYLTGNFALSLESPQTIASFAVNTERYKLPKDFYANYLKNIEAVTVSDIQSMANKYILPDHANILVVGKASEVASSLAKFDPQGKVAFYDIDANPYDPSKMTKPVPEGVTGLSVLQNYIQAIGGTANISKVKDLTMKAKVGVQGMSLDMTIIHKVPGKYLSELLMNGQSIQKQVLNGETGKMSGMQGTKDITGEDLEKMKIEADLFPELQYVLLGYKIELKEIVSINGEDAYKVDLTSPSGSESTEFYSVASGLKLRSQATMDSPMGGKMTSVNDYLEYSEVNGVKYPKKMKQVVGPQSIEISIESIDVNTDVKDEVFN